tara:strand:+ start:188 stop:934 length:747 start_codon:yes stop_codon:yes gene_type:complete
MWGLNPVFWFTRCFKTGDDLLQVLYKPDQAFVSIRITPTRWTSKRQFARGAKKLLGEEGYGYIVHIGGTKPGVSFKEYMADEVDDGDFDEMILFPVPDGMDEGDLDRYLSEVSKYVEGTSWGWRDKVTLDHMLYAKLNARVSTVLLLNYKFPHLCPNCDKAAHVGLNMRCGYCGHTNVMLANMPVKEKYAVLAEFLEGSALEEASSIDELSTTNAFQNGRDRARAEKIQRNQRCDIIHDECEEEPAKY